MAVGFQVAEALCRVEHVQASANLARNQYDLSFETLALVDGEKPCSQFLQVFKVLWPDAQPVVGQSVLMTAQEGRARRSASCVSDSRAPLE